MPAKRKRASSSLLLGPRFGGDERIGRSNLRIWKFGDMSDQTQPNPLLKLALDIGPLLLFFFANSRPALFEPLIRPIIPAAVATGERAGIFVATAVFMVAILV